MDSTSSKPQCIQVLNALERAIRCSQHLPLRDELQLIRVTSPALKQQTNQIVNQLMSEIKSLSSRYAICIPSSDADSISSQSTASISARDSLHELITETTDEALQHFNTALDAARNIRNAIVQPQGALNPNASNVKIGTANLGRSFGGFLDIEKPQTHFPDYPIDNSHAPFIPPYTTQSQEKSTLQQKSDAHTSNEHVDTYLQELYKSNSNSGSKQRHPYEAEILGAHQEMAKKPFNMEETIVFKPVKSTPCTFVTSEEELFNIAERLKKVTAIAVDIENHSVRSFQGFTCLIQISTREEDIIIDTLKLRGAIHRALAPIFTDETIVKVLHGADKDVQWLERDFGIYVVNMFDTGQASRLLRLPSASLAFMLTHFCDVAGISKKKFQLADWRQRPLPRAMFNYARSDTHYLLYVYDRLRAELAKKDLLEKAWERSAIIARKRHKKAQFQPGIAKQLAARHSLGLDEHQIRLLEELCKWRDTTAREEDESLPYVAPLKVIFGIVLARDKARSVEGLLKYGFPGGLVPPLIYKNAEKLTQLIRDALDAKIDDRIEAKSERCQVTKTAAKINHVFTGDSSSSSEDSDPHRAGSALEESREAEGPPSAEKEAEVPRIVFNPDTKLRVSKLSRSLLLDSDLESDSDSAADSAGHMPNESVVQECLRGDLENQQNTSKECGEGARSTTVAELPRDVRHDQEDGVDAAEVEVQLPYSGKRGDSLTDTPKLEVNNAQMTRRDSKLATSSVFDLSDFSEAEDEHPVETKARTVEDTVASVRAEIAAENSRRVIPTTFLVETDKTETSEDKAPQSDQKAQLSDTENTKAEEVVSLIEAARRSGACRPAKRRKKGTVIPLQEEMKPVEPFDYDKAIADEEIKRSSSDIPKVFNPMQKLSNDWKLGSKKVAKKRRRGRGRSMSFKAK